MKAKKFGWVHELKKSSPKYYGRTRKFWSGRFGLYAGPLSAAFVMSCRSTARNCRRPSETVRKVELTSEGRAKRIVPGG